VTRIFSSLGHETGYHAGENPGQENPGQIHIILSSSFSS